MSGPYKIAVVGAGPGGISAAARAAELELPHILLEASPVHANTIQRYQKGKHVMAEPNVLPLRSSLDFAAGTREDVLDAWESGLAGHKTHIAYDKEVVSIQGQTPKFTIETKDGETMEAEHVIFAIGVQGNPRKLGVDGEDDGFVQYTLDDPDEYQDETIVVVGAGDAAIENAVALTRQNTVLIINRRDEFARAKDGNLKLIAKTIESGAMECFYSSSVARIEKSNGADGGKPCTLVLNTEQGEASIPCDRIIARLGAIAPRRFVESCGIEFPNEAPTALPELTSRYESNVPGLYIIGALGGYPLIKQAMNQGYEVVEYILGNDIEPADEPILKEKFTTLPYDLGVDGVLQMMQERVPLLGKINALLFRELMMGSTLHTPKEGETIFKRNDYTDTFFALLDGEVTIEVGETATGVRKISIAPGQFFGEMSLLSGRRRSGTAVAGKNCVLVEAPRREINKLINSLDEVKRIIDEFFIIRAIQTSFVPDATADELKEFAAAAKLKHFAPDEVLFTEGDDADDIHLIRSGSVSVSREIGGREIITAYVAAGNYIGEMGLLGRTRRMATVRATVSTETVTLDEKTFRRMLERNPALHEKIKAKVQDRIEANMRMQAQPESGDLISFLMQQGLGEATDVLLIDESLCVGCDNCEKACAETHFGNSRLDRKAGPSFAEVHVPTSCRHCEDPHCMTDCPPDAIRRAPNGEVYIRDNCIGCGNCERNCPYGVIRMAYTPPKKPGLTRWLLFGSGTGPGQAPIPSGAATDSEKKAVKCDMCKDLSGGPACVRACPTGAALRLNPEQFVDLMKDKGAN